VAFEAMKTLKAPFKRVLHSLGYDFIRYSPESDPNLNFAKTLESHKIDLVIDIGANTGQYGDFIRNAGYRGKIISFEPMSSEHQLLLIRSNSDPNWIVAPAMAIGDTDGKININIASNSGSSSLLPMLDLHKKAAPCSAYIGTESVNIYKLDTVINNYVDRSAHNLFLKLDVQGSEWAVLDGAQETLTRVSGMVCECSFSPLYAGEKPWLDLMTRIEGLGFDVWGIFPGFSETSTGRVLQADFLFFRRI